MGQSATYLSTFTPAKEPCRTLSYVEVCLTVDRQSSYCRDSSMKRFLKLNFVLCVLYVLHLAEGDAQNTTNGEIPLCFAPDGTPQMGHESCFKCVTGSEVVSIEHVCDGVIHCPDLTDECLCEKLAVPYQVCSLLFDYDTSPELLCANRTGHIDCGEGICLTFEELCGGMFCPNGLDKSVCPSKTAGGDSAKVIVCKSTNRDGRTALVNAIMCDGALECDTRGDECDSRCLASSMSPLPPFCNTVLDCIPGPLICDGFWDSDRLSSCNYTRIENEEYNCPERYYCQSNGKISIPKSKICDLALDCDDLSDENAFQNCTDDRLYCYDTDKNSSNLENLFVPKSKFWDGKADCPNGKDECFPPTDLSFNSEEEMISSTALRWILWISGVFSFLGNLAVTGFTISVFIKDRKKLHKIARCHHLLLINLSIADLLMGVYLLAIGIQSLVFSGSYCEEDIKWRSSTTCSTLGALALISSEMSVGVMVVMAGFRFATIYRPLITFQSNKTETVIRGLTLLGWVIAIAFAVVPFVGYTKLKFSSHAIVDCPIFEAKVVEIENYHDIFIRFKVFANRYNHSSDLNEETLYPQSLEAMNALYNQICRHKEAPNWFGFYGQNSICLPRIFARPGDSVWEYSITFITYNFLAFFGMLFCYAFIIQRTLRTAAKAGSKVPQCKLQARVTRLLLTDFLCWMPICIIGFLYASGTPISSTLYAVCGIVLLPINSALNPILYSPLCEMICGLLKKRKEKNQSGQTPSTTPTPMTSQKKFSSTNVNLTPNGTPTPQRSSETV